MIEQYSEVLKIIKKLALNRDLKCEASHEDDSLKVYLCRFEDDEEMLRVIMTAYYLGAETYSGISFLEEEEKTLRRAVWNSEHPDCQIEAPRLSPKDAEMILVKRMQDVHNVSVKRICEMINLGQALGNALFLLGID